MNGFVRELFTSIQGEGLKVGQRQTFVRLLGCNLSCMYCDTPETQKVQGPFIYQNTTFQNPVDVDVVVDKIIESVVAITGGEPLMQIDFLKSLCTRLRNIKKRIYLDTNSTLPDALRQIIEYIDTAALDFKIPSATGGNPMWNEHEECLKIAAAKEVFVKIVIDENFSPHELTTSCDIIEKIDKNIPLVIQPVFGHAIPNILEIQKKALSRLKEVRIIPQVHRYLNLP